MREDNYQNRCTKQLKEWGAPLEGWYCESVVDVKGDEDDWDEEDDWAGLATCELCGCERVRFLHVMGNPDYFEEVNVGCICAGIMEGDIPAAVERDREMRNRAGRKRSFLKRKWRQDKWGVKYKSCGGEKVYFHDGCVICGGKKMSEYKGRKIADEVTADYAGFILAEKARKEKKQMSEEKKKTNE